MLKRTFHPGGGRPLALVALGTLLVATTYGMARFGVGVLHPAMADERPALGEALASAGSAQFVSYCLAAALAGPLVARTPRLAAGLAGGSAALGCLGLSISSSPGPFVVSAFVAGTGAGLASPAVVQLLDDGVPAPLAAPAQTLANAGTAVGVVGAGVIALVVATPTPAWVLMALLCLVAGVGVALVGRSSRPTRRARGPLRPRSLLLPAVGALVVGAGSAGVWTHGPSAAVAASAFEPGQVGWLWVALGAGGLAGALVDRPVRRLGPALTFALCSTALAVGTVAVVAPPNGAAAWPLAGAAVFGAAYMGLSGALILWGRLLDPARGPALTAWLFVALAVGQATGAQLLEPLADRHDR